MTDLDPRDDTVRAYLEARTRVDVPADLLPTILRTLDTTGPRTAGRPAWLAPVLAVAASLVLAVAGLAWLSSNAASGPGPSTSPSPSASTEELRLVDEGVRVELPAVDEAGQWGTVTITRGPDRGGYRAVANVDLDPAATDISGMFFHNHPDRFYVELQVAYAADRSPVTDVGRGDWLLIGPGGDFMAPISVSVLEPELMTGPGATDIFSTPVEGRLVFAVPRDFAAAPLSLVYQPTRSRIVVREAGPPPAGVPDPQPPDPVSYVAKANSPIAVIDSASADALFADVRTCTDPATGFSIDYPSSWTVVASQETACGRFEPPSLDDPTRGGVVSLRIVPAGTSVQLGGPSLPGSVDPITTVGSLQAMRGEAAGAGGGFIEAGSLQYAYLIGLDGQTPNEAVGRTMVLDTAWNMDLDAEAYRERKAVIDRMVASLEVKTR